MTPADIPCPSPGILVTCPARATSCIFCRRQHHGDLSLPPSPHRPSKTYKRRRREWANRTAWSPSDAPPLVSPLDDGAPANRAVSSSVVPVASGRKRALLIGIHRTAGKGYRDLKAAHADVERMRLLLIDCYNHSPADITLLVDDGKNGSPTRDNILREIDILVRDVQSGDRLFFYCVAARSLRLAPDMGLDSGHSKQIPNRTKTEDDDKDECIVPKDGPRRIIVDNVLYDRLVCPLPAGSHLVAVLDTCHSGSLLDLPHYRCNRVDRPDLRAPSPPPPSAPTPLGSSRSSRSSLPHQGTRHSFSLPQRSEDRITNGDPRAARPRPRVRIPSIILAPTTAGTPVGARWLVPEEEGQLHDSPHGSPTVFESPTRYRRCTGFCRFRSAEQMAADGKPVLADVVSLAAAKDSQRAWEGPGGETMTSCLVELLRKDKQLTLQELILSLSYHMQDISHGRHARARDYKPRRIAWTKIINHKIAWWKRKTLFECDVATPAPGPAGPASVPATKQAGPARAQTVPQVQRARAFADKVVGALHRRARKVAEQGDSDEVEFQNPELASGRPLDLKRVWMM
ncbi:Metacaspase type II [Mycena kentingensis (nom. inval.)]|nr:Metacaspase type II [Mycena kentingensis (nom. inval.)]